MGLTRLAVLSHLAKSNAARQLEREQEASRLPPRLAVSSVGKCPRAMFYLAYQPFPDSPFYVPHNMLIPHDDYTIEIMEEGYVLEDATAQALEEYDESLSRGVVVSNAFWRGHIDYLIDGHIIIDNKGTNPVNFSKSGRLPYLHHCKQVLLYGRLLREMGAEDVETHLYYRCWGNWAEFEVYENFGAISWSGEINDRYSDGSNPAEFDPELIEIEHCFECNQPLPRYSNPLEHGWAGCLQAKKNGVYPACQYAKFCWPELADLAYPTTIENVYALIG